MSYINKPFEELNVMDDFLMNAIAADAEVGEDFCRSLLSVLLGRSIGKIKVVAQYTLPALTPKHRGIRMDVEIEEYETDAQVCPVNIYDLEPHLQRNLHLPRRNRFYQAKIDSRYVNRGEKNFSHTPNLFILTILNYDPFGYDYMMYTFENRCMEVADLQHGDGLKFIYFYTGGTKGGSKELKNMLQYLRHSTADNATDKSTRELHDYVSKVKTLPEVRQGYMKFDELIYYERMDAIIQAIFDLLEDYGEIPESLIEKIQSIDEEALLKKYLKLAAKSNSIAEFEAAISRLSETN